MATSFADLGPLSYERFVDQAVSLHRTGWVFRGQSNCEWPLATTYARYCGSLGRECAVEGFRALLLDFIATASRVTEKDFSTINIVDRIALAQHHGLPTPYLDWTESPYIATFFALSERVRTARNGDFAVWAYRRRELPVIEALTDEEFWDTWQKTTVPLPVRSRSFASRRMSRQRGLFLLIPPDDFPANESQGQLHKLTIRDDWRQVLASLDLMGISAATLFDSVDGAAADVVLRDALEVSPRRL